MNRCSLLLSWQHGNSLALFIHVLVAHDPVNQRKQSIITPHSDVFPRMNSGSELTHEDISGAHRFAAENLYATALALTVAAVARTTTRFLMCHNLLLTQASIAVIFKAV